MRILYILILLLLIFPQQSFAKRQNYPHFKKERPEFDENLLNKDTDPAITISEPSNIPTPTPTQIVIPTPSPTQIVKTPQSYNSEDLPDENLEPSPTPTQTPTLTPTPTIKAFDLSGYVANENLTVKPNKDWRIIDYLVSTILRSILHQIEFVKIFV